MMNQHIRDNLTYLKDSAAFIREGGSVTEGSTTSTAGADVVVIGGLSIAPTRPMMLLVSFRKTTVGGSLLAAGAGLNINGTTVSEAVNTNNSNSGIGAMSNTSTSESAFAQVWVGPRVTNYRRVPMGQIVTSTPTGTQLQTQLLFVAESNSWPTNTTTAIVIRGKTASPSATLYVSQVHIYSLAGTSV